jgi:hypothetical protein
MTVFKHFYFAYPVNRIGGLMVSVLSSTEVDRGFKPKTIKYVFVDFTSKQPVLRRKSKDWLAQIQDNVSKWGDISIRRLVSVS